MAFNDQQDQRWDPNYRRSLRHDIREAIQSTYRDREGITLPEELLKRLRQEDKLYEKVVSSREAVLDSEHFKLLSEIARHQSESARGELIRFDPLVYTEKLLTYMGGRLGEGSELEWNKLGERFLKCFKVAPTPQFLHGALDPVPAVVRTKSTRRTERSTAVAERPKEISGFEQEEENTTKDVQHILSTLRKLTKSHPQINYFKFLVDPESYSRTVENMFHFSFLIKEGRAGVKIGEDDQPYIYLPTDVDQYGQSKKKTTNQVVVSINMEQWQMLIKMHNITEAAITRRTT